MDISTPTLVHLILMSSMVVLLGAAATVAFLRKGSAWLTRHRLLAAFGVACGLAGLVTMFAHKTANGWPHFRSPHAIGGLVALILAAGLPAGGVLLTKGWRRLAPFHRWGGRIAVALALLAAVFGFRMAFGG